MNSERIEAIATRWSLVRQAHRTGTPASAEDARKLLVLRYAPAIRRYIGAIVRDAEQADDLAQESLLRLMRGDFAGADPARGRFRDLLKTALRNMVRNHWEKQGRRRAADADLSLVADRSADAQDSAWTSAWQRSLLDHTWARYLAEEGGQPTPGYRLLKLRSEYPDDTSEQLAEKLSQLLGKPVKPDAARQQLRRARQRFASHLLDEVQAGLDDETPARVEEELAALGLLELVRDYLQPNAE